MKKNTTWMRSHLTTKPKRTTRWWKVTVKMRMTMRMDEIKIKLRTAMQKCESERGCSLRLEAAEAGSARNQIK